MTFLEDILKYIADCNTTEHRLRTALQAERDRAEKAERELAEAHSILQWYGGYLRPEDRLQDNGDKASTFIFHHPQPKDAGNLPSKP